MTYQTYLEILSWFSWGPCESEAYCSTRAEWRVILFIVKVCQKLATLRGWILLRHLKGKYYFKLGWDNLARRFYKVTTQENFLSRKKLLHLQEFYVKFFPHNTLYQFFKCMLCCHAFQRADGRPDSYHLVLLPSEGQHNSD